MEVSSESVSPGLRAWKTGAVAGACLGLFDAIALLGWGIEGLGLRRILGLVAFETSVVALVGAFFGLLVDGVEAAARWARPSPPSARQKSLRRAALAGLLAAPFCAWVGVSAFRGHWAASLPGHHALSALLAAAGTLFVAGVAAWAPKARAALAARGERSRWSVTLLCFALALASGAISRQVLPRLYGWFHLCLVLVAFGALFAAVTAWPRKWSMADPSTSVRRRWRFVAAFLLLLAVGVTEARRSQTLRFALHEKTVVGKELLARLPLPLEPRTLAAVERQSAEDHLPPLPEGPRRPDADVLLITVDALRADHVGAYGYPRATTPNIDALARKSTRFDLAYTQAPHTSFSVASMLTGKYFPTLARLAPAEVHDPLAAVLRSYGWRTAAFYPPAVFYVDAKKLKPYQDTHFSFEYVKFEYLDADKRVDQIGRYFDEVKPARAFLWVHFFEPHEPYETHAAYDFGGGDVDRYDSEIAYTDAAIGRLLALVAQRRPETIVILAADHGEEFDEHGGRYHGSTLYEEQVRVPFLIYVPGVRGHVIPQPVELLDITPTILSLLDVPVPERVRGTDLGPWLADPPADPARLPPAFAEVEDKRMIVQGREKLICDLNWGFCAFYDLAHDPAEKHNLAESEPAKAAALRGRLDEWLDGHVRLEPRLGKGLSNPDGGPVPRAIERGRLGDLSVARDLADLMMAPNASVAVRREAAQLLTALPPRAELAAAIERGLSSDDMGVADWAAVAAARLGLMQAVPRAEAIVQRADAGRLLRVRAGLALANVGSAAGVPAMVEALDDRDDILQVRLIVLALGKLRDRRAVPALLEHVEEVLNRREMVDALGDIGDPRAVPSLITHLKSDAYVPVRAQAAFALAKIARGEEQRGSAPDAAKTAEDVRTALREVLRDEREVSVREAAVAALGSLTRPPGASAETKTRARRR